MKIKLIEPLNVSQDILDRYERQIDESGHELIVFNTKSETVEEAKQRVSDADILIIANSPLPGEVIEAAGNLKHIAVAFTGIDHVDVEACRRRNISISNAAGYSDLSVAELTLGLTLSVFRNIDRGDTAVRNGGTIAGLQGRELHGKTVGVVGTGRIGTRVCNLFAAFDCKIIANDYNSQNNFNIEYVDIDELMSQSDIVTLHIPMTPENSKFIDAEKLALMKKDAVLINCARGGVVDNEALAEALNTGKIAGAGIDVYDIEPPLPIDAPLLKAKNTVLTPHVAYATDESMIRRAEIVFGNIQKYLAGNTENIINI